MIHAVNTRDVTGSRGEQLRIEGEVDGELVMCWEGNAKGRHRSQREIEQSKERGMGFGGTAEKWGSGGMEI